MWYGGDGIVIQPFYSTYYIEYEISLCYSNFEHNLQHVLALSSNGSKCGVEKPSFFTWRFTTAISKWSEWLSRDCRPPNPAKPSAWCTSIGPCPLFRTPPNGPSPCLIAVLASGQDEEAHSLGLEMAVSLFAKGARLHAFKPHLGMGVVHQLSWNELAQMGGSEARRYWLPSNVLSVHCN